MSFMSQDRGHMDSGFFREQFQPLNHNLAPNSWVYVGQLQKSDGHIVYVYHNFVTGAREERAY